MKLIDSDHAGALGAGDGADAFELEFGGSAEAVNVDDVLVLGGVAASVLEFVSGDLALGDGHPAELSVVGVDGGLLARRPSDGHDLEEVVAVDEVASVEAVTPPDVVFERFST